MIKRILPNGDLFYYKDIAEAARKSGLHHKKLWWLVQWGDEVVRSHGGGRRGDKPLTRQVGPDGSLWRTDTGPLDLLALGFELQGKGNRSKWVKRISADVRIELTVTVRDFYAQKIEGCTKTTIGRSGSKERFKILLYPHLPMIGSGDLTTI